MDYLYQNVPYFREDYLRLFEIVDYLNYFRLLQIIADYLWIICFGLFWIIRNMDYFGLFETWIICGLFETWII